MNQVKSKYQEFLEGCLDGLKENLGEGYNVQVNTVLKNNSITMDGVVILKDGAKMTPNIYLEEYYKAYLHGTKMEEILQRILDVYTSQVNSGREIDIQFTFDAMKDSIIFRLVNKEKNQELLKNCPYIEFLDLAVTFHCLIQQESASLGTIRITNEHLELWQVTKEELLQQAFTNTPKLLPPVLRQMEDVLKELLNSEELSMNQEETQIELQRLEQTKEQEESNQNAMYILSNVKGINGASCMMYPDVIRNFCRILKCNVYVLPSSIHEVILLPAASFYEKEQLEEMVYEINQSEVPYEEVLSDHVYYYSLEKKQLMML